MTTRFGRACYACLGHDQVVLAYFYAMPDLHEVVDLGAPLDPRFFEAGAVDGGVCPNVDIVFDDHLAEVLEVDMATPLIGLVTKSTGADHGAWLDDHPIADAGSFAQGDVRVDAAVCAYVHAWANGAAGANGGAVANVGQLVDDGVWADRNVFAKEAGGVDDGGGMDAGKGRGGRGYHLLQHDLEGNGGGGVD